MFSIESAKFKFDKQGNAIPYYGTTIISFVNDENSHTRKVLEETVDILRQSSFSDCLAELPNTSFHMTILPLLREIDRDTEQWPNYIDKNLKFIEIDKILKQKVDQIKFPDNILMEVDKCTIGSVRLKAHNDQIDKMLRDFRDTVSKQLGICHAEHDEYVFHMSTNYVVKELSTQQKSDAEKLCNELTTKLKNELGVFKVQKPDFVIFNDMLSYETDISKRGLLF